MVLTPASRIASLLHCTVIICMCDSGHGALSLIFLVILRSGGAQVDVKGLGIDRMCKTGATIFFLVWETFLILNKHGYIIEPNAKCAQNFKLKLKPSNKFQGRLWQDDSSYAVPTTSSSVPIQDWCLYSPAVSLTIGILQGKVWEALPGLIAFITNIPPFLITTSGTAEMAQ